MSWFWKSKSAGRKIDASSLQAEVNRLQALNTECSRAQAELRATSETALAERDQIRLSSEQTISQERRKLNETISELTRKNEQLELDLSTERQKTADLDQAKRTLSDRLQERDSTSQRQEERLRHLEGELAATTQHSNAKIAELKQQIASDHERATARLHEIEQHFAAESMQATAKIQALEQQVAESEARSVQRAEQRSALLRNLAEIHRLSMVSSKAETSREPIKILNSAWAEPAQSESA